MCALKLLSSLTRDNGGTEKALYGLYFILGAAALAGVVRILRISVAFTGRQREKTDDKAPVDRLLSDNAASNRYGAGHTCTG